MIKLLKSVLKKILPESFYMAQKRRVEIQRFKEWTPDDDKRLSFYRQFIDPDDIVFDVGANMGNRSKIFSKLGKKVVGVEPQSYCRSIYSCESIIIRVCSGIYREHI